MGSHDVGRPNHLGADGARRGGDQPGRDVATMSREFTPAPHEIRPVSMPKCQEGLCPNPATFDVFVADINPHYAKLCGAHTEQYRAERIRWDYEQGKEERWKPIPGKPPLRPEGRAGTYRAPSESIVGREYKVQVLGENYVCSCLGFVTHGHCKHGEAAVEKEKAQ